MKTFNLGFSPIQASISHFKQAVHSTTWNGRFVHIVKGSSYFLIPLLVFGTLMAIIRLSAKRPSAQQPPSIPSSTKAPKRKVQQKLTPEQVQDKLKKELKEVQRQLAWTESENSPVWEKRAFDLLVKVSSVQEALLGNWGQNKEQNPWMSFIVDENLVKDLMEIARILGSLKGLSFDPKIDVIQVEQAPVSLPDQSGDEKKGPLIYAQYKNLEKIVNRLLAILHTPVEDQVI